ncbi:MAG: type 4a pilus biogenesis protein PilO [Actinomycetota bacterium]
MIGRSWRSVAPPALVVVAVLGLGVWPSYRANDDADARRAAAEAQMIDLQLRVATLTPLAENGDLLENQLIALDALVPGEHDIAGFIVELDGIADDLGVELRDVVPSQASDREVEDAGTPGGWSSVGLNVRVVGSYLDLIDFVEATTRTERLAVIDSININTSGQGELDAAIAMRLFRNDNPADGLIARYAESRPAEASTEESQP